jgi:hypothetical protein
MALAVIAMMGCGPGLGGLAGADAAGGFEAVHDRHLHVHQHRGEAGLGQGVERELPVLGEGDPVAAVFQQLAGQPLVDPVVLDQQHRQAAGRRRLPAGPAAPGPAPRPAGRAG